MEPDNRYINLTKREQGSAFTISSLNKPPSIPLKGKDFVKEGETSAKACNKNKAQRTAKPKWSLCKIRETRNAQAHSSETKTEERFTPIPKTAH